MSAPSISVLLPVYDAAAWLDASLASLCRQTFDDFEVLLQDDGSADDSRTIAERHARGDERIRIEARPHTGIVGALEAAADRARGSLLVRMDADDLCVPERLERLWDFSVRHPEVGWLSSRVRYVPADLVGPGMRRYEAWVNGLLSHDDIVRDRFVECPLPHPTWAIRAEVFRRLGGYREGDFPEDYELFLRACHASVRFAKLPEVLLEWREGPHRLCRNDPRYDLSRFFDLKRSFLVPHLEQLARPVAIVGAGRWGKRWGRALQQAGLDVRAFLDVSPRRIGGQIDGIPVHAASDLDAARGAYLLVAVGSAEGRAGARNSLRSAGFDEGTSFLCVQ